MHLTAKHSWKLKLAIALFLIGQSFSIAHATEHGSGIHDHDGVACIGILSDENDLQVPGPGLSAPVRYATRSIADPIRRTRCVDASTALKPPATGPPSI